MGNSGNRLAGRQHLEGVIDDKSLQAQRGVAVPAVMEGCPRSEHVFSNLAETVDGA